LNVIGAGATTTIIDGNGANIVIDIYNSRVVTLSNITIRHGRNSVGAGIDNENGLLTINNSTISGNASFVKYCCAYGAGIYNGSSSVLTINNSTISGNGASCGRLGCATQGGGILNDGKLIINNSTIAGNTARGHFGSQGGGIYNQAVVFINNSTVHGNGANEGGGIYGLARFQNSIVAGNGGGNCSRTQNSYGYNLSSDGTCNFANSGDRNNTDPMLGPLQNNGGPTQTMALPSGSPAIDAGNPSGCTDGNGHLLKTDQRGYPRPDKEDNTGCDMGAYEKQSD
jgi:hypothetical protein